METTPIPAIQRITSILWPSFLVAGLATILIFTAFDPVETLANAGWGEHSRLGAYTIGFFSLWLITAVSSAISCHFISCKVPPRKSAPSE